MKLEYQCTLDDYQEAWAAYARGQRREVIALRALGVFGVGIGAALLATEAMKHMAEATICLFFGVWLLVSTTILRRLRIATIWKANPFLGRPVHLEAGPDGAIFQSPNMASHIRWQAYVKWVETPRLFLLYLSAQSFQMVPKRAFADDAQREQFRAWLGTVGHPSSSGPPIPEP